MTSQKKKRMKQKMSSGMTDMMPFVLITHQFTDHPARRYFYTFQLNDCAKKVKLKSPKLE